MHDMKIFVPITKIDTARRLVFGVVTAERPDGSGEVCDYASTKPLYQKWSQNFAEATDGRSLGNLRAMHGNVAAGKVVDIAFNDSARQVEICGKVVDDAEWQKVEEGVYTGFSQGGRYLKRWPDPSEPSLTRYTAEPLEISLVDHPCLPEATFSVLKADGSMELRKFKTLSRPVMSSSSFGKIGARHAKVDKDRIRHIHDLLVALDPDCCAGAHIPGAHVDTRPQFSPQAGEHGDEFSDDFGGDGDDNADKFVKALRQHEQPLGKVLQAVTAQLAAMNGRLYKIEDQPLPLGTSSVRVVEKSEDGAPPSADNLLDRPGALEALAEAAIRRAHAQPMRTLPGARQRP
jgi:hypothetical protein